MRRVELEELPRRQAPGPRKPASRRSPAPYAEEQRPARSAPAVTATPAGPDLRWGRAPIPLPNSGGGSLRLSPEATRDAASGTARGDWDTLRLCPVGKRAGLNRLQAASVPAGGRRERSPAAALGSHSVGTTPPSGFGPRLTLTRSATRPVPSPLQPQLPRPRTRRRCLCGLFRNCAGAAFRDWVGSARSLPLCAGVRCPRSAFYCAGASFIT